MTRFQKTINKIIEISQQWYPKNLGRCNRTTGLATTKGNGSLENMMNMQILVKENGNFKSATLLFLRYGEIKQLFLRGVRVLISKFLDSTFVENKNGNEEIISIKIEEFRARRNELTGKAYISTSENTPHEYFHDS